MTEGPDLNNEDSKADLANVSDVNEDVEESD